MPNVFSSCKIVVRRFTLIELLVVIAIIAILASMLLPSLSQAKRKATSMCCGGRLRQLSMGQVTYADDFNGHIPPLYDSSGNNHSWTKQLIPYLGLPSNFSSHAFGVFLLNGAESAEGRSMGHESLLSCPAAAQELNSPKLVNQSYGRNYHLYDGNGNQWFSGPAIYIATAPVRTISFADTRVVDYGTLHSGYAHIESGVFSGIAPLHPGRRINMCYLDGHVAGGPPLRYTASPYLPGEAEDVWRLMQ